ncbi:MAG: hypothetical protein ABI325_10440 [Ginsengibacter sp.]
MFESSTDLNPNKYYILQNRIDPYDNIIRTPTPGSLMVNYSDTYLAFDKQIFLWSPFGYDKGQDLPKENKLTILTPRSIVDTFRVGHTPQLALS